MTITLRLQLLRSEPNQLFLDYVVLVSNSSCLFLCFISLLAHRLDIEFERLGALLKDSHLLARTGRVVVQLMHLIVVHLDVTRQVRAPALVNTDFFSKLCRLHLELTVSILDLAQLLRLFFDESIRALNLISDSSFIALHGTLKIVATIGTNLKLRIFFPKDI